MRINITIYWKEKDEEIDNQFGSYHEAIQWLHVLWEKQEEDEVKADLLREEKDEDELIV